MESTFLVCGAAAIPENAVQTRVVEYEAELENIPIINLRADFRTRQRNYSQVYQASLVGEFQVHPRDQFDWDNQCNYDLRESVLGLECYTKVAVWSCLHRLGKWAEHGKAFKTPPGRGSMYEKSYCFRPALLTPVVSLDKWSPWLWGSTQTFYKGIRNPLFHGHRLARVQPVTMVLALQTIQNLYQWIDNWYDIDHGFVFQETKAE